MGGGLLIPKTFVILTIALKTPLKHLKITQKIPTLPKKNRQKMVEIPKRGGWGGVRHLGKIPKKFRIFFLRPSLIDINKFLLRWPQDFFSFSLHVHFHYVHDWFNFRMSNHYLSKERGLSLLEVVLLSFLLHAFPFYIIRLVLSMIGFF